MSRFGVGLPVAVLDQVALRHVSGDAFPARASTMETDSKGAPRHRGCLGRPVPLPGSGRRTLWAFRRLLSFHRPAVRLPPVAVKAGGRLVARSRWASVSYLLPLGSFPSLIPLGSSCPPAAGLAAVSVPCDTLRPFRHKWIKRARGGGGLLLSSGRSAGGLEGSETEGRGLGAFKVGPEPFRALLPEGLTVTLERSCFRRKDTRLVRRATEKGDSGHRPSRSPQRSQRSKLQRATRPATRFDLY